MLKFPQDIEVPVEDVEPCGAGQPDIGKVRKKTIFTVMRMDIWWHFRFSKQ